MFLCWVILRQSRERAATGQGRPPEVNLQNNQRTPDKRTLTHTQNSLVLVHKIIFTAREFGNFCLFVGSCETRAVCKKAI